MCKKYYIETSSMANKRPSAENVENFYANVDQNLGWCLIPKVNNIQGVWSFTRKKCV